MLPPPGSEVYFSIFVCLILIVSVLTTRYQRTSMAALDEWRFACIISQAISNQEYSTDMRTVIATVTHTFSIGLHRIPTSSTSARLIFGPCRRWLPRFVWRQESVPFAHELARRPI